jgi:DNA polymerase-3 subunit alpha
VSIKYPASLHNHTQYSNIRLRDCIIKEKDLIDYAIELGHSGVAITDHECISNSVKVLDYYKKVKDQYPDFKVVLGNEIYLCRNGLSNDNFVSGTDRYYHFILLAKDAEGHRQIREISTRAWMRSYMARGMRRVPTYYQDLIDIIGSNPGHVIGSTACLGGALPTQLLRVLELSRGTSKDGQALALMEKVETWIVQMDEVFGHGNFFFEMQPSHNSEQIYVNKELLKLSEKFNIPYIITTDSHYLKKEDRFVHKAFLNSQKGDREVDDFYASTYMMDTEELEKYFSYLSKEQLIKAYATIQKILDSCEDYELVKPLKIPQLPWNPIKYATKEDFNKYFDKVPMFKEFLESDDAGDQYIVHKIIDGIIDHEDLQNQEAYDEINSNLEMIKISSKVNNASWSTYILNLQRIIDVCWEAGSIVGPGRGSGVGFILLYVLGITQINPLREKTKTFSWRFLNPNRVSVLDVDFDIEGGRRDVVLNMFREVYGNDRVSNVATFGTEKSKSAILTAARGLGIDVDIASYISSLIPADRGLVRTLSQCMYGDKENNMPPIKQFVIEMTENYPELWEVACKIEGLVNRLGAHAGGVIFVDEPFTNSTGLMRSPDGTIITAFELHDDEAVSLIKYDALSVEAMDKIHICLDLLCDGGLVERKPTLKETYESIVGIYNLERDDPKMWNMVWNHEITSLFQMEQQSGIQGIALAKPASVDDLATLNSVIRLMAQERGAEQPLSKFARFKNNPELWDEEMERWGLTDEERAILHRELDLSYGICESQEGFMTLVQIPECGGFDLTWADRLRKSIAKKNPADYEKLTEEYYANAREKGLSRNLCGYVWQVLVAYSRGYGFNKSHTLAYSLIALQEMNLAYKYPTIFWNCACLISDSGGAEVESNEENSENFDEFSANEEKYYNEIEEFGEDDSDEDIEKSYEEEDVDGYPSEVVVMKDGKKKKKVKSTNYGKIATTIGKMRMAGIEVAPPDINKSTFTFSPDVEHNTIRYGLSGISKIGDEVVKNILSARPYESVEDLTSKVKITKPQVINLIKSGAFDFLGDREEIMRNYVASISDQKKRITLQNMKMLIDFGLIPDEYDMQKRVYNFNKYLKKQKLDSSYYGLDLIGLTFYERRFDMDNLETTTETESGFKIKQTTWDKIYQSHMDIIRPYVKEHNKELLDAVNNRLMKDTWDKYCLGSLSKWEMDSVSYYSHEHELAAVDDSRYGFSDFFKLSEEPDIDRFINIKGKRIPLFKIHRIIGTVLDKDKARKSVTLLTKSGVVTVKIYGAVFTYYDRQISERGADGKKHVIEKSMFQRGNKLIITGIRRESDFLAKKYSRTPWHLVEKITQIGDDGSISTYSRTGEE